VTDPGSGYTYATASVTDAGAGTGATLRPIISPPGGHGSDPLYELGGKNVRINVKIKYDEGGTLPATNDIRQIAIIKDPLEYGSSNVFSSTVFLQAHTIIVQGTGDYDQDETVYQGASLLLSSYYGKVVSWDSGNNKLLLINTKGTPVASRALTGGTSFTSRNISSIDYGDLHDNSGKVLYVNNIEPITRASDQIESYQIIVKW